MLWGTAAIVSAVSFALVNVIDRRILTVHIRNVHSYYIWIGLSLLLYGVTFLGITGLNASPRGALLAVASGSVWGTALLAMVWALRNEEASRVVAVYHTYPVFVAVIAVAFLGESISAGQWVGIMAVVGGAALVSLRGALRSGVLRFNSVLPVLILASLCVAGAILVTKLALNELDAFQAYPWRSLGMGAVFMVFLSRSSLRGFLDSLQNKRSVGLVILSEFVLAQIAVIFILIATDRGPVSLVAALTSTRPLFVFLACSILSIPKLGFLDEPLRRDTLLVKGVSISMIVGGVALIQLA